MSEYRPKSSRWSVELQREIYDPSPMTVFETDDGTRTGILDQHGRELFRYDRVEMGFLKDRSIKRRKR